MAEREVKQWITINGQHIPIMDGESKDQAVNRYIAEKNEDTKEKQIAKAKEQADTLNGKSDRPKVSDNTDFKAFIKDNMSNPDFKKYGQQHPMSAVKELWYDTRAEEEKKNLKEMSVEDAILQIREAVPERIISKWFREADSDIKPKLMDYVFMNKGTLNAGLNIAYHNYLNDTELKNIRGEKIKPLSFQEWLTTPQKVYRGEYGQNQVDSDIFVSYTPDKKIAEKFGEKITETEIRPIDTWGSYQTTAEQEFLVPRHKIKK